MSSSKCVPLVACRTKKKKKKKKKKKEKEKEKEKKFASAHSSGQI